MGKKRNVSSLISELKRKTRKAFNSEEKIRIVIRVMRMVKEEKVFLK